MGYILVMPTSLSIIYIWDRSVFSFRDKSNETIKYLLAVFLFCKLYKPGMQIMELDYGTQRLAVEYGENQISTII